MSLTTHQKNIVLWSIVIILFISFIGLASHRSSSRPATLEFWGTLDNPQAMSSLITKFHRLHPNIHIKYTSKDSKTYYQDLIQAFASGKSPDMFMLLGNWLPLFEDKITPLNMQRDKVLTLRTFNQLYPEAAKEELVKGKNLEGIPLYIDTLALYYNKDIFDYSNIALPPSTWKEVLNLVPRLRKMNPQGRIKRAAIALGTGHNTNWSTDIISTLMMQYGSSVVDPKTKEVTFNKYLPSSNTVNSGYKTFSPGEEALKFYTQFSNPRSRYYTWNDGFLNSILAFTRGQTAMFIGYNRAQKIIKKYSPGLNYGVAPLPRFSNNSSRVSNASIMTVVVSKQSSNRQAAWLFLKFLAQKDNAQFYFLQTKNPPARRDLIRNYLGDPQVGTFISQTLSSRTWYQFDFQQISQIFTDMIDSVLRNNIAPSQAITTAAERMNLLNKKKNGQKYF